MISNTTKTSPWTSFSEQEDYRLKTGLIYVPYAARWKEFPPLPSTDYQPRVPRARVTVKSRLSRDMDSIFARFGGDKRDASHPLKALAKEALAAMKGRALDANWHKRIGRQMTDAAD
jgi:hypothetical protein